MKGSKSKKKSDEAEIIDWYKVIPKKFLLQSHNPNEKIHNIKLPFRMLIVGGSGSGKTQTFMTILHNFGNTFNNIYIITKNKNEPLYNYLEEKTGSQGLEIREGINSAPDLDKLDIDDQTLIVMDDLVLEKNQRELESYFIRGRKLNCSFIYISQSYFAVPQMIRKNLNYLVIKRLQSLGDLFRILREYSLGVDKNILQEMYEKSTSEKPDFLMVDLEAPPEDRFRKNFKELFDLS
jgi:ABC-type dipeptide/oligopeptide/nickel transport system ATPase component